MNPRLYQAMDLLQMPLLDLQQHLKAELEVNPFLEFTENEEPELVEPASDSMESEPADQTDDDGMDWQDILLDGFDGRRRPPGIRYRRRPAIGGQEPGAGCYWHNALLQ